MGGPLVFISGELGQARLKVDTLVRLSNKAIALVKGSKHRDHFFEVAGDIIRDVPELLFQLQQFLDTAALGTTKLEYEGLKQQVPQDKVNKLEESFKDPRVKTTAPSEANVKLARHLRKLATDLESGEVTSKKRVVQSIWELVADRFVMDGGFYYPVTEREHGIKTASSKSDSNRHLLLSAVHALINGGTPKGGLSLLAAYLSAKGDLVGSEKVYQASEVYPEEE